ncbi:lebercilin [Salarias fasciatus]|uniref:lebercilin n=1 Tax=Salarias fasciatus TaxID=181472 RepID=UPI001176D5FF|nr:lebercilin-like [Salarias fasciatus]
MESENIPDPYEDNRDVSLQNTKRDSRASSSHKHKKHQQDKNESDEEKESSVQSRSKTRTRHSDPDRDQVSDGESGRRSIESFYSEDYENESLSDRSCSPYSPSRTPSPVPRRGLQAKRANSLLQKTGVVGSRGMSRPQRPGGQPLTQQLRRGVRSQSKESIPPKDLDLVTKRMLSARLLKINELRNALAELQQRTDELQKENRILRQLQVRQEKALQRYDDTESEISQLLTRHSNDMQVLRERLRRTQERERVAEKRLKDREEQLQRSQVTIGRLKKLVSQRELGERDELNRRLEEEKTRAQEAERKIRELERSIELSNSSFQRQLVAEKKKTISAHEEIKTLQEELDQLTNKLRDKERELDAKNIYANRMAKPALRKEADIGSGRKVPSRSSSKAVQTEGRASSLDFPTPPPAISDVHESCEQPPDEYLSLKELNRADKQADAGSRLPDWEEQSSNGKGRDKDKEPVKEEQKQALSALEEKAKILREESKKEKDEDRKETNFLLNMTEKESYRRHGHVQEEVEKWNQENLASQQAAEEARRRKDKLLAKMREIDFQNHGVQDVMFGGSGRSQSSHASGDHSASRPPEQRKRDSFIFLTESEGSGPGGAGSKGSGGRRPGAESDAVAAGPGRRALRSQISSDDLAFGSYAPSFGNSGSRASLGFPPPPPKEDRESASDAVGVFSLREAESEKAAGKDKKASLMQQLFGAPNTSPAGGGGKTEVFNSPPAINGVRSRREGLLSFSSGSSTPPASSVNSVHVADSRPAVCAIASFDDDLEELTL